MKIIGAGLSGLIAAHAFPKAAVFEASPAPRAAHGALLRFRSDAVSNLTGIEFKKVTVQKGIWSEGVFREPNIRLCNLYAQKVIGAITSRSIQDISPVTRFIAPENFYERLLERVGDRVKWGQAATGFDGVSLSTIPLPLTLGLCAMAHEGLEFKRAAISVCRFRVPGADIHQTIYFPDESVHIYRASMTGSLLIVESTIGGNPFDEVAEVIKAFGFRRGISTLDENQQEYGKIASIQEPKRKALLLQLTQRHNVYSIGRFAIWKNILLDDVVKDLTVVRRMMESSAYDQVREAHE